MMPTSINGIQFCDLSDWYEQRNKDEAIFQKWYENRFDALLQVISNTQETELNDQIRLLEQLLSPAVLDSRKTIELQKLFVNREWLANSVETWLKSQDSSKYLLLYGEPGSGKSAFSAHYFHFDARVAVTILSI